MPPAGPPRPPSPTRSVRSDLVRSFTTSSDTSASERIAAAQAARAARRRERATEVEPPTDDPDSLARVDEATGSPEGSESNTQDDATAASASTVPHLRVQPTSDRSYSPSVPSSPAKSKQSTSSSSAARSEKPSGTAAGNTHPPPAESIPELAPAPSQISISPPRTPSPTPSSTVSLAGGLMERLKAQRAARAALDAQRTEPETASVLPPGLNRDSTPQLFRGIPAGEDAEHPHVENPGYEPPAPVTALRNVDASTGRQSGDFPASARSPPERPISPLSVRSTQASRVYGRNGEEFDFDFHQLSDVQELTERSSISTWQPDRRHSQAISIDRPSFESGLRRAAPVLSAPSGPSEVSSTAESVSAGPSRRNRPDVRSSWSLKSVPLAATIEEVSETSSIDQPVRHLDATSQLLGRSASTASIFSEKSSTSTRSDVSRVTRDLPGDAPDGRRSPVRRVSPEVARRAALFGSVAPVSPSPPPSPSRARLPTIPKLVTALSPTLRQHSSEEDLREATPAPPVPPKRVVPDSVSESADSLRAPSTGPGLAFASGIRYEGYLLLLGAGATPTRRYCVLTDDGLEYRPTDQVPDVQRQLVVAAQDLERVDFEPAVSAELLAARPFSVVMRGGETRLYAAEKAVERLRWITALRSLISATATRAKIDRSVAPPEPARSLTPPGSYFSVTRGTVRDADWPEKPALAPLDIGFDDYLLSRDTKLASPDYTRTPSFPARIAVARTISSTSSDSLKRLSPPPLPPKSPLFDSSPDPEKSRLFASSSRRTLHSSTDAPPTSGPRGPAHSVPTSRSSDGFGDLRIARELRDLRSQLELADLRKEGKRERHKRLRERLAAFRSRLDGDASSSNASRESGLAAKVDYLIAANEKLLRNQEHLEKALGERAAALEANERELARKVEHGLRDLVRHAESDHAKPEAPARGPNGECSDSDNATLTTRAGVHSPSERLAWAADLERYEQAHQERVSQVVAELARWVAEDRSIRDVQFRELVQAVEGITHHVSELRGRSGGSDSASMYSPPLSAVELLPDEDTVNAGPPVVTQDDAEDLAMPPSDGTKAGVRLLNPKSSFARAAQHGTLKKDASAPRGPRMPAFRLWGAPDPTGKETSFGRARRVEPTNDSETEELEAIGQTAPEAAMAALRGDEKLGQALHAIASGHGDEIDPAAISFAVLEILSTMRDIARKQDALEAKEAQEKARNNGLTSREVAELEIKRAEIARIEARTLMSEERSARINEMVAKLAEKTERADRLLEQIAKNVQEGKKTALDPALSEEVKRLLSGVRAGVDDHVKDFRGQLTGEIQRMFKEVGKLRDEKKALQSDIAELMAFHAKHGGKLGAGLSASAAAPPSTSSSLPDSLQAGAANSGFFGPRALR
ncbi:hypothetical protein JCM8202v2_004426 [Rhodotorula sphaerocarpa]